ncbi:MAG TPA: gluconate 2-dehydrogenase subunit 3 family protein [Pseudolabrys sp.]|nr:gluconate 2-dehydrogenase subunit 3 family protein [Pseudolabrys sp.]
MFAQWGDGLTVMPDPTLNRRQLLSASVLIGSSVALEAQARSISGEVPWQPGQANKPDAVEGGAFKFFTQPEAKFIDAAVSRLIPSDDLGPGAKEAGATFFIDRQLAGDFGKASSWYMQGPWRDGERSQGYQSRMSPAELYRAAIKAIDDHCREQLGGKTFSELEAEQQDNILSKLETGELELTGADAKTFFKVFLQNTVEGFFCDPIHGGNRDMVGWKLIGFPGARYDYRPYVKRHGEKLNLPPVGLKGRPEWTPS